MSQYFVNPMLMGGAALIAVPILIHLLMRQKPIRVPFPAIRFLLKRRRSNLRNMRIKHWLLLALRCLAVLLIAAGLARPRDPKGTIGTAGNQPGAAVLIFDTSPSMQYVHQGKSLIERAKEMGLELVTGYPDGSELAIIDSSEGGAAGGLSTDVGDVRERIQALQPVAANRPLNSAVVKAVDLLRANTNLPRREIYIFTDMAQRSWDKLMPQQLAAPAGSEQTTPIPYYVINLAVDKPQNAWIHRLRFPDTTVTQGKTFELSVTVGSENAADERLLEVHLGGQICGNRSVKLGPSGFVAVKVPVHVRSTGVQFGKVVLKGKDGLAFDDVRYFTLESVAARNVLVVSDRKSAAKLWMRVLAPEQLVRESRSAFRCRWVRPARLDGLDLGAFDMVSLIDVATLSAPQWAKLAAFVDGGGGLAITSGPRMVPASYNVKQAEPLMPAKLGKAADPNPMVTISQFAPSSPIMRVFARHENVLKDVPIENYRTLGPLADDVHQEAAYSDGAPAVLRRSHGQGRVVMLTTTVDTRWNDLPYTWDVLALVRQIAEFACGMKDEPLAHNVGERVEVRIPRQQGAFRYVVTYEGPEQLDEAAPPAPSSAEPGESVLDLDPQTRVGHYLVSSAGEDFVRKGFSLNVPAEESRLKPVDPKELKEVLGQEAAGVAADRKSLKIVLGRVRLGREFFEFVILGLLIVVSVETFLSNRFYRR